MHARGRMEFVNGWVWSWSIQPTASECWVLSLLFLLHWFCSVLLCGLSSIFCVVASTVTCPSVRRTLSGLVLLVSAIVVATLDGALDRVVAGLDRSYTTAQQLFESAPPAPRDANRVGGRNSLVEWEALGRPGREFVMSRPDAGTISAFTARTAKTPLRVYVGLAQAPTPEERAQVALAELQRIGGFEREVLIIALPTGTGWLDPGAIEPVEYMHDGDIATVSAQYSYLQSPLALILETRAGLDQARALIDTIHSYWRELPDETRPRLYIHGLSLGACASMHGTDLFALLDEPIDGALWVGPPFPSQMWRAVTSQRNSDSPYILPRLGTGRVVRFASHYETVSREQEWGNVRIVYLQYSSDPIVFYEPSSLFRAPRWMREPPAPDVSPDLQFMPIVTQFQLALDMALATSAPPGHGHTYYGPDYVRPWVAVTDPENWTRTDTQRLIEYCDNGFQKGCANER